MTKKYIKRAEADVGLIFTAYNLRRIINILGFKVFQRFLKKLCSHFFEYIVLIRAKIKQFKKTYFFNKISTFYQNYLKNPYIYSKLTA